MPISKILLASIQDGSFKGPRLDLQGSNPGDNAITDQCVIALAKALRLRLPSHSIIDDIDVSYNSLTNDSARLLALLPLRSINMASTHITKDGVAYLAKMESLRELNIASNSLEDEVLQCFAGNQNLISLTAHSNWIRGENPESFLCLEGTAFKKIDFGSNGITGRCIASFLKIPSLQYLNLPGNRMDAADANVLAQTKTIAFLNMTRNAIGDSVAAFSENESIQELRVGNNNITDAGLRRLSQNKRLIKLDVSGNQNITSESAALLAGHPALQSIDLSDTGINNRIIQAFIEKQPSPLIELKLDHSLKDKVMLSALFSLLQRKRDSSAHIVHQLANANTQPITITPSAFVSLEAENCPKQPDRLSFSPPLSLTFAMSSPLSSASALPSSSQKEFYSNVFGVSQE